MSEDAYHYITARIDHLSDGVGCFNPMQVMARMRGAFPELVVENRDFLWEACEYFIRMTGEGATGALRIAVRDLQERGPKFLFHIPLNDGRIVKGTAERYWVNVRSTEEFPEEFRQRFTDFLKSLTLQTIEVSG